MDLTPTLPGRKRSVLGFALAVALGAAGVTSMSAAASDEGATAVPIPGGLVASVEVDASVSVTTVETSTSVSSTSVPSTTVPSTTVPSTTVPSTTVPSTTVLSTTSSPTSTPPVLPVPEPVPAEPYPDEAPPVLGSISIPAIGLVHEIYEGVTLTAIDQGPGHWPGTAAPGAYGNAVFGGHRSTHSAPFFDIDQLEPGDEIVFDLVDGSEHVYRMTEQFVVDEHAMWIVDQAPGHTLTLFACHPKGSSSQRIVTRAELVASSPAAPPAA